MFPCSLCDWGVPLCGVYLHLYSVVDRSNDGRSDATGVRGRDPIESLSIDPPNLPVNKEQKKYLHDRVTQISYFNEAPAFVDDDCLHLHTALFYSAHRYKKIMHRNQDERSQIETPKAPSSINSKCK